MIERRVVDDDDVMVERDVQVEFDHLRALADGEVESAQSVFGFVSGCAAMGDDDWLGVHRGGLHRRAILRQQHRYRHHPAHAVAANGRM